MHRGRIVINFHIQKLGIKNYIYVLYFPHVGRSLGLMASSMGEAEPPLIRHSACLN